MLCNSDTVQLTGKDISPVMIMYTCSNDTILLVKLLVQCSLANPVTLAGLK